MTVSYKGQTTSFKATGVWSEWEAVSHDQKTYAELIANGYFAAIDTRDEHIAVKWMAETLNGTGLKNRESVAANTDSFYNMIVWAFKVSPAGVADEKNVMFDITRRVEDTYWRRGDDVYTPEETTEFPDQVEYANDDEANESDESTRPDDDDIMFSIDGPGISNVSRPPGLPASTILHQNMDHNFEEFVRVSFSGAAPEGVGVQGTRASSYYDWHANLFIAYDPVAEEWNRAKEDGTIDGPAESQFNSVGQGHAPLDHPPM